jgi:hypothetical protein
MPAQEERRPETGALFCSLISPRWSINAMRLIYRYEWKYRGSNPTQRTLQGWSDTLSLTPKLPTEIMQSAVA